MVLSFHGGPEGQERPGFNSTYQALLANGIAVFAPNVRGSSGFGKKFVNLDNGVLRKNGVKDIEACVARVVGAGLADPKRVGVMGGSYGGYMVMAGLSEYPQIFAAGADLFGVVNFETFFKHTEPWMAAISKIEYGDPDKEAEMLRDLSPIHKVDRVVAPTIVLHGANDTNVPGRRGRAGRREPEEARRAGRVRPLSRRRARLPKDRKPHPRRRRDRAVVHEIPEGLAGRMAF